MHRNNSSPARGELVVHLLEAVEVEKEQRERAGVGSGAAHRAHEAALEQAAIREAREAVVERDAARALLARRSCVTSRTVTVTSGAVPAARGSRT